VNTMDILFIDAVKITVTVVSLISLYLFRRQITKVVTDIMTGQDTSKYERSTPSDIIDGIDRRLEEVLK